MERGLTVECDGELRRQLATLARENDMTEEEVARQLIEYGIECLD